MVLHCLGKLENHFHWQIPENIIQPAIFHWRKRLQVCVRANGGHFQRPLWTKSCKQFAFLCVFGSSASAHAVRLLLCWCLMVDRPTFVNYKASSLLRIVNEQKSKMLIFCIALIFARIFMTFDKCLLDRWYKVAFETCFACTKSAKFLYLNLLK